MAFEIEEVEVEEYDPCELVKVLYPQLNLSRGLDALFEDIRKRKEHTEFWSDVCWSETI